MLYLTVFIVYRGNLNKSTTKGSVRFTERTSAGEVVANFGPADNTMWKGSDHGCSIAPYGSRIEKQYKYMFQKLTEKAHCESDVFYYNKKKKRKFFLTDIDLICYSKFSGALFHFCQIYNFLYKILLYSETNNLHDKDFQRLCKLSLGFC
jgi:hypothetical protein